MGARPSESHQETYFYCNALFPYEVTHQTNLAEGGADARAALAEDYGKKDAAGCSETRSGDARTRIGRSHCSCP